MGWFSLAASQSVPTEIHQGKRRIGDSLWHQPHWGWYCAGCADTLQFWRGPRNGDSSLRHACGEAFSSSEVLLPNVDHKPRRVLFFDIQELEASFMRHLTAGFVVFTMIAAGTANADLITDPLPANTYITFNDLDWAWASSLCTVWWPGPGNRLKEPEFHEGWRYATPEEWANRPSAEDFLAIPGDPTSVIHAVPYWNTRSTEPNYYDALRGFVTSTHRVEATWETWYVRDSGTIPEPSTPILLAAVVACLACLRRRTAL